MTLWYAKDCNSIISKSPRMLREILQRELQVLVISDKLKIHQIEAFNTYKLQIKS